MISADGNNRAIQSPFSPCRHVGAVYLVAGVAEKWQSSHHCRGRGRASEMEGNAKRNNRVTHLLRLRRVACEISRKAPVIRFWMHKASEGEGELEKDGNSSET